MWELIKKNERKSMLLFVCMGACLLGLGLLIGAVFFPPNGAIYGLLIALFLWLVLSLISYFGGDSILLGLSGAQKVTHDVHPQLFNIVEEMKISAGLPAMPEVYIVPDSAPNAFATGVKPKKCAIVVTAGLLSMMSRDELQGVVAHEMSHILNRDVLFMTFAAISLGSIVILSEIFLRSLWFGGGSSKRYKSGSSGGGGQAQIIILAVAIVFAILSPIIARLLYFAMSRKREYLADASAARLTRYPEGLASALQKLANSTKDLKVANKATAPMYIVNPLKKEGMRLNDLSSTHPPISERIRILRNMHAGSNFSDYNAAFSKATEGRATFMPASALRDSEKVDIRKPSVEKETKKTKKDQMRDIGDIMRAANKFFFIICACGLKIKVPPDFKKEKLACPKCGLEHNVPLADLDQAAVLMGAAAALSAKGKEEKHAPAGPEEQQAYERKGAGWETFSCKCGKRLQISPAFLAAHMTCTVCKRVIRIKQHEYA